MPTRAPRPCGKSGCRDLTAPASGYCRAHQGEAAARKCEREADRPSARQRGYGTAWSKASKAYLQKHPLCEPCLRQGITDAAQVVDHIVPHRGNMTLFWDRSNWQAMSKTCHDRKTATEDSGFARRGRKFPC